MTEKYTEDKRLLGALDYIDEKFIAEVTDDYEIFDYVGKPTRKMRLCIARQYLIYAACLALLACAMPIVSYIVPQIGELFGGNAGSYTENNPVHTQSDIKENNSNVIGSGYYLYGSDIYYLIGNALRRCNIFTNESQKVCECDKEDCLLRRVHSLAGIYDERLYFMHRGDKNTLAYLDLKTMQAVKIIELEYYLSGLSGNISVYDGYIYYTRMDDLKSPMYLCRASIESGEEEKLLECEGETLELVANGYIITEKRISANNMIAHNDILYSYSIDTLQKKVLWSTIGSEFFYYVSYVKYLDGKLYFISWWAPGRTDDSNAARKLLALDISTGNYECLIDNTVNDYCLMNDCIYYFPQESRFVNYTDYASSSVLGPGYGTDYGASIHKCDLNGKNDEVVYENSDFAYCYPKIINGILFDDSLIGDFPELDLEKSRIHASIDFTTDKINLIEIINQQGK